MREHGWVRTGEVGSGPVLLTLEEAAEILSVPVSWLRKRVANHALPCTRLGRHIRFTREQVAGIVEAAAEPAVAMPLTGLTRRSRRTA
jgi:excisionase family DNA binding protein